MTVAALSQQDVSVSTPAVRRRPNWRAVGLLTPAGLLLLVLGACAVAVLRISFGLKNAEWDAWTLANYQALADASQFRIFLKTIVLAFASAVAAAVCAFPIAVYMTRTASATMRRLVLICVMLPMLISLLVQSYGWIAILGPEGLLNRMLALITGSQRATSFLFNDTGVLLGLIQTSLPLAVLPIVSALATVPRVLEEAASVLGASRLTVYREIILPMIWPGVVTGALLVFAFNTGAFAVPLLLGGLRVTTVAMLIRDQMGVMLDWPLGGALSVALVVLVMAVLMTRRVLVGTARRTSRG